MLANADDLARILNAEMGKPFAEARARSSMARASSNVRPGGGGSTAT